MIKAGDMLKEARLKRDLSLEEVSESTKIKTSFLEYIEKGEFSKLPAVSYASGFVRNYAKFLGLREKEVLALFRREYDEEKAYKVLPRGFEPKQDFSVSRLNFKYSFFIILAIFALFIAYIFYQYRYAFINPPLEIYSPKELQIVNGSRVDIKGKTDPNSTVYINEVLISVDQMGNFDKIVAAFPGKLIITIKAINRFGKQTEVKRIVEVKPAT